MQSFSKIIVMAIAANCAAGSEAQKSFFMDDEDSQKAIFLAKQRDANNEQNSTELKLSGIFFIDEQNWTIWLNNATYSDYGQHGNFSIDEVSENEVTITTSDGEIHTLSVK